MDIKDFENAFKRNDTSHLTLPQEWWDKRTILWEQTIKQSAVTRKFDKQRWHDIANFMIEKGILHDDAQVLDLGCGPGRYSTHFAKYAKHVTGIDISPVVLDICKKVSQEANVKNVEFIKMDIRDIGNMKWEKKFDVVFATMSSGFWGYEAIKNAISVCKGYCFNSSYIYRKDSIKEKIYRNVLNKEDYNKCDLEKFIAIFGIVSLMGYYPNVLYYPESSQEERELTKEYINNWSSILMPGTMLPHDLEDKLKNYLYSIAKDGKITENVESMFGWMYWKV